MPSTAEMIALLVMSSGFAQAEEDLLGLVEGTQDLSVLSSLVNNVSDFNSSLVNATVFAPIDDAFNSRLAPEILDKLKNSPELLEDVLKFHVVGSIENSTELLAATNATTEEGTTINITADLNEVLVEQSKVTKADVKANKGIAHLIDYVLFPNIKSKTDTTVVEVATQAENAHRTLSQLLIMADLTATLSKDDAELTVFAPTNEAFAEVLNKELTDKLAANVEVLRRVLEFHVVLTNNISTSGAETATLEGSNLSVNGSIVLVDGKAVANITGSITTSGAGRAVVKIIDRVLVPKDVDLNALLGSDDGISTVYIILYVVAALACLTIIGVVVAVGMRNKRRAAGYQAAEEGHDMK